MKYSTIARMHNNGIPLCLIVVCFVSTRKLEHLNSTYLTYKWKRATQSFLGITIQTCKKYISNEIACKFKMKNQETRFI